MSDWERQHRQAQRYKEAYPPGTRIMLLSMNDPHHPVESGTRGTVEYVDDVGTLHMKWDNGQGLGLVPDEDKFAEKQTKSANYLRIVSMLRHLLSNGKITEKEYCRAKKYYKQLTGADIVIAD